MRNDALRTPLKLHRSLTHVFATVLAFASAGSAAAPLAGQNTCTTGRSWSWIGVDVFHCPGGSCAFVNPSSGAAAFEFTTEPWLRSIDEEGPAAGLIADGDVLLAVNDHLITSVRGGEQLARLTAGSPARLTVRRADRLHSVDVTPESRCEPPTLVHGNVIARGSSHPSTDRQARHHTATSHDLGLGMGLRCDDCVIGHAGEGAPYVPSGYPVVIAVVEDGAAARAGVREGDRIVRVNGEDIRTAEGVSALFGAQPGESLRLQLLTDGVVRNVTLTKTDVRLTFSSTAHTDSPHHREGLLGRIAGVFRRDRTDDHFDRHGDGERHVIADRAVLRIAGSPWTPAAFGFTLRACDTCSWAWNNDLI